MKNIRSLHEQALRLAKIYRQSEADLIAILSDIGRCRGYREYQCKSLFEYSIQCLGLSESVSYNLISIARKSREVPALHEQIQKKELSVSNAHMIVPILTEANQVHWIERACTLSKKKLEQELAREFPNAIPLERINYVTEDRLKVQLAISDELHAKLKRAQDLVSSRTMKAATLEETLEAMTALFLEKEDPVERAKRVTIRRERKSPVPGQVKKIVDPSTVSDRKLQSPEDSTSMPRRTPIPQALKHEAISGMKAAARISTHEVSGAIPEGGWTFITSPLRAMVVNTRLGTSPRSAGRTTSCATKRRPYRVDPPPNFARTTRESTSSATAVQSCSGRSSSS